MLFLIYLLLVFLLGDAVCRRFFSFISIQHRLAAGFLSGLLISTIITYLAALVFAGTVQPLIWANLVFWLTAALLIPLLRRGDYSGQPGDGTIRHFQEKILTIAKLRSANGLDKNSDIIMLDAARRPAGRGMWDWVVLGACCSVGVWLFLATLDFTDGSFQFSIKSWSDFGANLSLAQSLTLGHNFPTEHPFFPGEAVCYHFLFWFQSANLSFLGLNLVWSVNLLSLLSLAALIILMMTFAEVVFSSRVVGRIAAMLFFVASSSLAYIPFLLSNSTMSGTVNTIVNAHDFLKSGYPFRGDDWGALSVAVFSYQRHLISAVGIMFVVLIFLVDLYRRKGAMPSLYDENSLNQLPDAGVKTEPVAKDSPQQSPTLENFRGEIPGFIFCGVLMGLMPYWNSAVFVSAAFIFAGLFVFMPYRRYLVILIGAMIAFGLPQVLMLRSGHLARTGMTLFHVGYTIPNPTFSIVLKYLGWTFGVKWLLIAFAMVFARGGQRKLFLAITLLLPAVFLFQFSTDAFNNHKLLNVWNTFASIYAAYALWLIGKKHIAGIVLAAVLALAMTFGAVIDLFPLRNDKFVSVPYDNDRLTKWLTENTKPNDLFLTDTLLSHPILFTGHKIYLGNTLFAWTAGYQVDERENKYRRMLQERNVAELGRILIENKIDFVAIDDGLRGNQAMRALFNESIYKDNYQTVFEDAEHRYGNLVIYKISAPLPAR